MLSALEPEEVAKTVVVRTSGGYVRVVLPASERVDLGKVRALLGTDGETRLATEAELAAAYPEFELGAVPPLRDRPASGASAFSRRRSRPRPDVSHDCRPQS